MKAADSPPGTAPRTETPGRTGFDAHALATILEQAKVAVVVTDTVGKIVFVNPFFEQLTGYSRHEALGKNPRMLNSGMQDKTFYQELWDTITAGAVWHGAFANRRRDGSLFYEDATIFPLHDDQGVLTGFAAVKRDVTSLRSAQDALQRYAHQLHTVAANVPAMIASFDAELRCEFANRSYCAFYDIDPSRIIGMTEAEILGSELNEDVSPYIEQMRQGDTVTMRGHHRTASCEIRHVDAQRVPRQDDGGKFQGYHVMLIDVTRQVRTERALRATEAIERSAQHRLESIVSSLHEVVYACKAETGEMLYVSPSVERLSGYPPAAFSKDSKLWLSIVHPADRAQARASVSLPANGHASETEYRIVRADGQVRTVQNRSHVVMQSNDGTPYIDGVITDITERRVAEERAEHLAQHDHMTGLPNRFLYRDRLEVAVARAKRRGETIAVMMLDIDHFSKVNEALGHDAGDELLRQVAARLRECLRDGDTLARFGGDKFALLAEDIGDAEHARVIVDTIVRKLAAPYEICSERIFATASIGVNVYPNGTDDPSQLLERAEMALWPLKNDGGNGYKFYQAYAEQPRGRRLAIESRLRQALTNREFALSYQPRVSARSGTVTGAEALLRWNSPDLGAVSPHEFICVAEETGLIIPIGEWVLRTACSQAQAWRAQGMKCMVAVNLSPRQFRDANLGNMVATVLAETGLPAESLELEITESTAMTNAEQAITVLRSLRRLGVSLAVDDFGTGYSSLNYLKRFPLHRLKIDRSFTHGIGKDRHDELIIQATIALAHNLDLNVTSEGVETSGQLDYLARAGCDEYQGYLFKPPLTVEEFTAVLEREAEGARLAPSPPGSTY